MEVEKMKLGFDEAVRSIFGGGWKWHFFHFKGEIDLLHIISKSNQEYKVWALALIFFENLDIVTYVCVAFFCGNAYVGRNFTIKMAKIDQICFFSCYIMYICTVHATVLCTVYVYSCTLYVSTWLRYRYWRKCLYVKMVYWVIM